MFWALALGILAVVLVCASFVLTYLKRRKTSIRHAQLDFMLLLLAGLLLVSIASVISALSDSDAQCVSVAWLFNLGYTLELVPLNVKVFAINHLMQAAKHFRRVELKRISLFGAVLALTAVTMIFMIVWTVIDPPQLTSQYRLTEETNSSGETVVSVCFYCRSSSTAWGFTSLGAQGFLLFVASVLAFQMRTLRHELDESQSLAVLIYSNFFFFLFRLIAFAWLEESDFASAVPGIYSLALSLDSIASICIYFLPKFFCRDDNRRRTTVFDGTITIYPPAGETVRPLTGIEISEDSANEKEATSDPLFGANAIRLECACPHCGREVEQELLPSELAEMAIPLNKTEQPSAPDGCEDCCDEEKETSGPATSTPS